MDEDPGPAGLYRHRRDLHAIHPGFEATDRELYRGDQCICLYFAGGPQQAGYAAIIHQSKQLIIKENTKVITTSSRHRINNVYCHS